MSKEEEKEAVVMTREELKGKSLPEIQELMANDVAAYEASLVTLDEEGLKAKEEELMNEMRENDAYLETAAYELGEKVEFDGETIKRGDVEKCIIGFLNRWEVEWRATLGIYQAIKFWKTVQPEEKIPYAVYDTTIRLLGTLKYKGYTDCHDVMVINNWLSAAHQAYAFDTTWVNYLAAKHQAIMKAMDDLDKTEQA